MVLLNIIFNIIKNLIWIKLKNLVEMPIVLILLKKIPMVLKEMLVIEERNYLVGKNNEFVLLGVLLGNQKFSYLMKLLLL